MGRQGLSGAWSRRIRCACTQWSRLIRTQQRTGPIRLSGWKAAPTGKDSPRKPLHGFPYRHTGRSHRLPGPRPIRAQSSTGSDDQSHPLRTSRQSSSRCRRAHRAGLVLCLLVRGTSARKNAEGCSGNRQRRLRGSLSCIRGVLSGARLPEESHRT